ncbi:MAG: hypothetical protein ACOYL1_06940, partial [Chlamydiia bacterium]
MFGFISGWALSSWYAYKSIKTKEYKFIIMGVFFTLLQLGRWPFYVDVCFLLGLYGLSFAALMGLELYIKKKIESAPLYIIG